MNPYLWKNKYLDMKINGGIRKFVITDTELITCCISFIKFLNADIIKMELQIMKLLRKLYLFKDKVIKIDNRISI